LKKRDGFERDPQADELAQARKKRSRKHFWRRVVILLLVGCLVWGVLFLRYDILRLGLGMRLSDLLASYASGDGYPAELPPGRVLGLSPIGKDLVLLTDTQVSIFNSQGKRTASYEHGYTNPICLTNGDRVLTFDRGGKKFRVDSRSKQLYSGSSDFAIVAADIALSGQVAVAGGSKYYQSSVTVYDQEYDQIYIRETADLVTGVCLTNNGRGMAVTSVAAVNGSLDSTITFFDFGSEDPVASLSLPGELVLSTAYVGRSSAALQVITDQRALTCSPKGEVTASYGFDGLFVNRFVNSKDGGIYLLLDRLGDGNQLQLVSLDAGMKARGSIPLEERVQDMKLGAGYVSLFVSGGILCYPPTLGDPTRPPVENCYFIQPAGHNLYSVTGDSIELYKLDNGGKPASAARESR